MYVMYNLVVAHFRNTAGVTDARLPKMPFLLVKRAMSFISGLDNTSRTRPCECRAHAISLCPRLLLLLVLASQRRRSPPSPFIMANLLVVVKHLRYLTPLFIPEDAGEDRGEGNWQSSDEFERDIAFAEQQIDDVAKRLRDTGSVSGFTLKALEDAEEEFRGFVSKEIARPPKPSPHRIFPIACLCGKHQKNSKTPRKG